MCTDSLRNLELFSLSFVIHANKTLKPTFEVVCFNFVVAKTYNLIIISMATFKFVLQGKVGDDGMQSIKFRITHKRVVRYITTDMRVRPDEFKDGKVFKRSDKELINSRMAAFYKRMVEAYDKVRYADMYSTDELIMAIRTHDVGVMTMKELLKTYVRERGIKNGSSATKYETAVNNFCEYAGGDIKLELITPQRINGWIAWLKDRNIAPGKVVEKLKAKRRYKKKEPRKMSPTTIKIYATTLKTLIRFAEKMHYVKYEIEPFVLAKIPRGRVRNIDLPVGMIRKIREHDFVDYRKNLCRDIFLITYYFCGINLIDLLQVDFRNADSVEYERTKSAERMHCDPLVSFKICDDAMVLVERYMNKSNGHLEFGRFKSYRQISGLLHRYMHGMGEELGIKKQFIVTGARKSFAQHSYDLGENKRTIDYCLGHSVEPTCSFDSYVTVKKRHADKAIDKVMAYLNSENAQENLED